MWVLLVSVYLSQLSLPPRMQRPGFVKAPNLSLTAVQDFSSYPEGVQEVKKDLNRSGRVAATCEVFWGKENALH